MASHSWRIFAAMELPIVLTAVPLPGGANWNVPYDRLLEALGSNRNRANFVLLLHALNGLKSQVSQHPIEQIVTVHR